MKNTYKDKYYYQRKYNFHKVMSKVSISAMFLFMVFAVAGWVEYHKARNTAKARLEVIKLGSRKIDSLTVKADYYQDWYIHHTAECVEGKVLTNYELNFINKIKRK